MKILMIITVDLAKNGISTCVLNYCSELIKYELEVHILAPNHVEDGLKKRLEKQGICLHEIMSRNSNVIKYFQQLFKLVKKERYDVIHVHGNSATMAIELTVAFVAGCRVRIAHSHNTTCEHQRAHKLLLPLFNKMYTHGVACGSEAGKWLFGEKKFTVLPNGLEISKYEYNASSARAYRLEKGVEDDQILIGHIGIFNYQKNHEFLVKMFAKLLQQSKKYRLLLVGDGDLYMQIRELVRALSIDQYVLFAEKEDDIPACLAAMDLFVLPSRFEGLPYVLVEAQASALPCIVSGKVTQESDLTGLVSFVDTFAEEEWIKEIQGHRKGHETENYPIIQKALREKGYDIRYNGKRLAEFYEKCLGVYRP